jgi:hypothetical protein
METQGASGRRSGPDSRAGDNCATSAPTSSGTYQARLGRRKRKWSKPSPRPRPCWPVPTQIWQGLHRHPEPGQTGMRASDAPSSSRPRRCGKVATMVLHLCCAERRGHTRNAWLRRRRSPGRRDGRLDIHRMRVPAVTMGLYLALPPSSSFLASSESPSQIEGRHRQGRHKDLGGTHAAVFSDFREAAARDVRMPWAGRARGASASGLSPTHRLPPLRPLPPRGGQRPDTRPK